MGVVPQEKGGAMLRLVLFNSNKREIRCNASNHQRPSVSDIDNNASMLHHVPLA